MSNMTTYVLAGGCFWCLDAVFRRLKGVDSSVCGYCGGDEAHASYYKVAMGDTSHAESVRVTFDELIMPLETLLDIYFLIHDPTTFNRQGNDVGTEYRSAMFYADDAQKAAFEAAIKRAKAHYDGPIVTELTKLEAFYPAEPEHQDYFAKNPEQGYCQIIVSPKVSKARTAYKKYFLDSQ